MTYFALAELAVPRAGSLCQLVSHNFAGFLNVSGTVYYINAKRVFETDIQLPTLVVYFNPVARVWNGDTQGMREILFREMDKLEWLFE
jgi:hypothetical protein